MLKLSIITINYNNAEGLKKTMESVFNQTSDEFDYIVIDGASTDGSKEIICQYANMPINHEFHWLSEPDTGIYNAMNKGIKMALGGYIQFLNSGDTLAAPDVTRKMLHQLSIINCQLPIIYGNMLKPLSKGILRDRGFAGRQPSMLDFYTGTLNHSPAYIKRSLFDKYGLYDEQLKIVSDWKWYLKAVIFGQEKITYADIDMTIFDMTGISTINKELDKAERKQVLSELLPTAVIADYERWAFPIEQMKRLNRYWPTRKLVWWVERGLFKWEKITRRKNKFSRII